MTNAIAWTCAVVSLLAASGALWSAVHLRRRLSRERDREVLSIHRCPVCGKIVQPYGSRVMYCSGNQLGPEPQPRGKHDSEPMERLTVQVVGTVPPQVTIAGGSL